MAHNGFPFRTSPGLPIFAEDIEKIKENWKLLSERGAKMIYPGHGNAFAIDKIFQQTIHTIKSEPEMSGYN
jgi:hypothetical protein